MPAAKIIHLRELLSGRFPGLRTSAAEQAPSADGRWSTAVPRVDEALGGGLFKGGLTEIISGQKGSGGALLLRALLDRAAEENQIVAMVDGADSLDVTAMKESTLSRMVWVRCAQARNALKAADLILRDGNFSLLALDLAENPPAQLRHVPATTWYRFQRLIEETHVVGVVFTPEAMIGCAHDRLILHPRFSIQSLETGADELLGNLRVEVARTRQFRALAGGQSA